MRVLLLEPPLANLIFADGVLTNYILKHVSDTRIDIPSTNLKRLTLEPTGSAMPSHKSSAYKKLRTYDG